MRSTNKFAPTYIAVKTRVSPETTGKSFVLTASIASLLLTTEALVADKPEEGPAMPMGGGDPMGGMGGMGMM